MSIEKLKFVCWNVSVKFQYVRENMKFYTFADVSCLERFSTIIRMFIEEYGFIKERLTILEMALERLINFMVFVARYNMMEQWLISCKKKSQEQYMCGWSGKRDVCSPDIKTINGCLTEFRTLIYIILNFLWILVVKKNILLLIIFGRVFVEICHCAAVMKIC